MSSFVQRCCRLYSIRKSYEKVFLRDFLHRNYNKTSLNVCNLHHHDMHDGCATSTSSVTFKKSSKRDASVAPLQSVRRWQCSSSASILSQKPDTNSVQPKQNDVNIIKLRSWAFSVELFGSLIIRTSLSVRVTPIDPHDYPAADRAFVHLMLKSRAETKSTLRDFLQRDEVGSWQRFVRGDVLHQEETIDVSGDVVEEEMASLEDAELLWLIEVPMSYDVDAEALGGGAIAVSQLENQICKLQTESGNIVTNRLKSDKVALKSASGDINCVKVLQGNITITTGNHGKVITDRLQGQDISVSAGSGAVVVKDVYARQAAIKSRRGDILLGNLHGDVQVSCGQGNVGIVSLDGSLQADIDQGNLSAYIVKHTDVNITCKQGDISIKTPAEVQTHLDLQASQGIHTAEELASKFTSEVGEKDAVQENTKLGHLNEGGDSSLTARAPCGSITLSVQSWFDSLQLQK